jgi:hypothetical protein
MLAIRLQHHKGYALAIGTPSRLGCSCRAKQEQDEQANNSWMEDTKANQNHELGSWIKQTGGIIDTRAHREVVVARLTTKQKPSLKWWLLLPFIGRLQPRRPEWAFQTLGRPLLGSTEIQGTRPKSRSCLHTRGLNVTSLILLRSGRIWWHG